MHVYQSPVIDAIIMQSKHALINIFKFILQGDIITEIAYKKPTAKKTSKNILKQSLSTGKEETRFLELPYYYP